MSTKTPEQRAREAAREEQRDREIVEHDDMLEHRVQAIKVANSNSFREKLWCDIITQTITKPVSDPTELADYVVIEFDKRFPK